MNDTGSRTPADDRAVEEAMRTREGRSPDGRTTGACLPEANRPRQAEIPGKDDRGISGSHRA
ncbi:MAG: hypothetical protein D6788_07810 [Planctomycetota bacterium]|nr:MAG: hypothetical protein D6788_07810 [Planctomycetota bacterium]